MNIKAAKGMWHTKFPLIFIYLYSYFTPFLIVDCLSGKCLLLIFCLWVISYFVYLVNIVKIWCKNPSRLSKRKCYCQYWYELCKSGHNFVCVCVCAASFITSKDPDGAVMILAQVLKYFNDEHSHPHTFPMPIPNVICKNVTDFEVVACWADDGSLVRGQQAHMEK